ncbi:uracil-DNA glycosylase [Nonomuraea sp. NBC_01738]|uniref:uracil-DNA glycosylase n=1 Tax=Nonomuraea sp. NBC_01738 TaxID=2976003 RepID=UPI002E0E7CD6|nr:uracil-DNA glycosylase [Nonomuraea sp. NBC_01738]
MSFVAPGTGWPGDPATADTPVAQDPADVRRLATAAGTLAELAAVESVCRACPRLVAWREEVAEVKRRAFADETYWGRPIAGWGSAEPKVLLVGLAPAAHGGNRTGRIFTGDRSGDWLFASLHRVGLAVQETSTRADDGQELIDARMLAAVRCAPPDNKPTTEEKHTCFPWLAREIELCAPTVRVIVALGGFAWQAMWPALKQTGYELPRARPAFGHGVEVAAGYQGAKVTLMGTYHPSQQNTFTGRLTARMLDDVFARARELSM